ncbi:hypothetical protein BURPS305_3343 [Burkholderia pseudomallei 305]|nr:hypothetical protein BGI47_27930 [Burkholderia pseudomallei]APZ28605.1 hypothetical protein BGI46_27920 [Burkholderia pseudomallei]EBA48060.1 hypothetical protein BURPS305_3343 [Burkholderia pseudomallei 305]
MTLARGGAAPRVPLFVRAGGVCFVLLAARGAAHARAYAMGDGRWAMARGGNNSHCEAIGAIVSCCLSIRQHAAP